MPSNVILSEAKDLLLRACFFLLLATVVEAQQPRDSSFFRKHDGVMALGFLAGSAALSAYDTRIARWSRQPRVQGDSSRHDLVSSMTVVNEMPLTAAAIATYGVGRLTRSRTVADVGLHWSEALIATTLVAEVIRVGLGRERPRANPDNAFSFDPGAGLTRFENRAFPSLHAAVAFATAASLSEEVTMRRPGAAKYVSPVLYGAALVPGFTRIYLDQHWASDVLAGSFVGYLLGKRVVQHAHGRTTKLDRILLGRDVRILPWNRGVEVRVALPSR